MMKTAGRPRQKPVRVTVTLAPHHAAELELMAQEAGVKISAYCAHVLERYSLQDRQVMTTDILKVSFDKQSDLLREEFRVSLNEQFNRVRSLLANINASRKETRGAPCPPAAISATRKSAITVIPVSAAITAASPICHVA